MEDKISDSVTHAQFARVESAVEKIVNDLKLLTPNSWEHVIRRALIEAEEAGRRDTFDQFVELAKKAGGEGNVEGSNAKNG